VLRTLTLLVLTGMVISACGGSDSPRMEITLDLTDFAYSPAAITIPAGQPVVLTIQNGGLVEHDFVIETIDAKTVLLQDSGSEAHQAHGEASSFDVHASAQVGDTTIVELTVSEPGTYQFFCSVEDHKNAGMIGELIVVVEE
jgi:plastocyanin